MYVNVASNKENENQIFFGVVTPRKCNLVNQQAQAVFSNYNKLMELRDKRLMELSQLQVQKKDLEKTWVIYLYNKNENSLSKIARAGIATILFLGIPGTGMSLVGGIMDVPALVIAGFSLFIPSVSMPCLVHADLFIPSLSQKLTTFNEISKQIPEATQKKSEITHLIKVVNALAEFEQKFSTFSSRSINEEAKSLFKSLNEEALNGCNFAIQKIVGFQFKALAPLFLMEKICNIQTQTQRAGDWKDINPNPELWGEERDKQLWDEVGMKNPSPKTYCLFRKEIKKNSIIMDPMNWCRWIDEKLDTYIKSQADLKNGFAYGTF